MKKNWMKKNLMKCALQTIRRQFFIQSNHAALWQEKPMVLRYTRYPGYITEG